MSTPSNTKLEESFFQYGSYLGAAILIKRDLEVINSSATAKADVIGKILTKKKNLTLSYVLESDNLKLKRRMGEIYSKRILSNKDLEEVKSIATESGAIDQTTESIAHLLGKSKEMLSDSHIEQLDLRSLETFTGKLFNT
jgi:geranylgeranyl pyrophosphate synthase